MKELRGLSVPVKHGNFEKALRKFRKSVDEDGKLKKIKENRYFTKPSEKKKIARKKAINRYKKKLEKQSKGIDT